MSKRLHFIRKHFHNSQVHSLTRRSELEMELEHRCE